MSLLGCEFPYANCRIFIILIYVKTLNRRTAELIVGVIQIITH